MVRVASMLRVVSEDRVLRGVLRVARILQGDEGDEGGEGGIIFLLHDEPLLDNYKKKECIKSSCAMVRISLLKQK